MKRQKSSESLAHLGTERLQAVERADHDFEVDDLSLFIEADQVDAF